MVDVVGLVAGLGRVQPQHVLDRGGQVVLGERAGRDRRVELELLVDLVAADLGEVVALGVEEEVLQQRLRVVLGRRLAGAQLAVDVEQGLVLRVDGVLLQGRHHELGPAEALADAVGVPADGLEQDRDGLAALAVDADADGLALVDVELEPGAAAGDDLGAGEVAVRGLVGLLVEVDAGRADELRDDDALGPVDDERPLRGHHREVAHEHRLALDLAGGLVDELRGDEQRSAVGEVLLAALLYGGLDLVEARVGEGEAHGAREVFDRADLFENLVQTALGVLTDAALVGLVADEPVEGVRLERQ